MTHEQLCNHNNIHEALLMNGYRWRYIEPEFWDDGDAESGPMVRGHGGCYEYISEDEYVYTVDGVIAHRHKRDHAEEAFIDEMLKAQGVEPYEPVYF